MQSSTKIYSNALPVITKQIPLLEVLTGRSNPPSHIDISETLTSRTVNCRALSQWIPRLPRLTELRLCLGTALNGNGTLIRVHCPLFKGLEIWDWYTSVLLHFPRSLMTLISLHREGNNSDQGLAAFLNDLRPQSLKSFETPGYHNIESESFRALSRGGESLTKLKLNMLKSDAIIKISLLNGCTNLVSLVLAGKGMVNVDLEISHPDVFLETVAWLKGCKNLRNLSFDDIFFAPALMARILSEESIRLTSLRCTGAVIMQDTEEFHKVLAKQTTLKSLNLQPTADVPQDPDLQVESVAKLVNLKNLHLGGESDFFFDRHIAQLASSLPNLEVWSMTGSRLTDAIWGKVASLSSLRRLELDFLSSFTVEGILDFIKKLGPGNKGLVLSTINTHLDFFAPTLVEHQELIKQRIAQKVGGRFELAGDY